jgi:hypothetical protein
MSGVSLVGSEVQSPYDFEEQPGSVHAWYQRRLQFSYDIDRPFLYELCPRLQALVATSREALHAVYTSAVDEDCDTENVLFYNVGSGPFGPSARRAILFERSFSRPMPRPVGAFQHMMAYDLVALDTKWRHWYTNEVASWGPVPIGKVTDTTLVWQAVRSGVLESHATPLHGRFALRVAVHVPRNDIRPRNLAGWMKALFDGTVSALHYESSKVTSKARDRLKRDLPNIPESTLIQWLTAQVGPLGARADLLASGYWNPRDDDCVAGRLDLLRDSDTCCVSGALYEVDEVPSSGIGQ